MIDLLTLQQAAGAAVVLELADDDGDGTADAGVVESAIAGAVTELGAQLARGGVTPDPESALHRDLVTTLAVARLHERRRQELPPSWQGRLARARALLQEIAEGRHPASAPSARATRHADDRAFPDRALRHF